MTIVIRCGRSKRGNDGVIIRSIFPVSWVRHHGAQADFFLDSVVQICYNDDMDVRSKIWLEIDGEPVFGSGREALLKAIDQYGSINKASKSINISYRKALSYIQNMEKRLGMLLVKRQTGGINGGGALLTDKARDLLSKYEELERGINELLDLRYLQVFGHGKKQ